MDIDIPEPSREKFLNSKRLKTLCSSKGGFVKIQLIDQEITSRIENGNGRYSKFKGSISTRYTDDESKKSLHRT